MRSKRYAVNHSVACIPATHRANAVEQHFDTALNAKTFGIFETTGTGQLIESENGESCLEPPSYSWPAAMASQIFRDRIVRAGLQFETATSKASSIPFPHTARAM